MVLQATDFYWAIAFFYYISPIVEVLLIIFYCYQFYKKNSTYLSVYYVLLTLGYFMFVLYSLFSLLYDIFVNDNNEPAIANTVENTAAVYDWYFMGFIGFWNFVIGLYRCTAVGLPLKHQRIWGNKHFHALFIVIVFPFIVFGYQWSHPSCLIYYSELQGICDLRNYAHTTTKYFVNLGLSFTVLALVIVSSLRSLFSRSKTLSNQQIERRLIFQTIFSTIFQIIFYTFNDLNPISEPLFETEEKETISLAIAMIAFMCQHYTNIAILFIISKNFRNDVFRFYRLSCLTYSKVTYAKTVSVTKK